MLFSESSNVIIQCCAVVLPWLLLLQFLACIYFFIWNHFSSIASFLFSFLEFSEDWETVSKFQLEILLFRCLLAWSVEAFFKICAVLACVFH